MRKRHIFLAIGLLSLTMLAGCNMLEQWLGLNFTVNGTLSASFWNLQSAGSVKVTNGTDTLSSTFTVPAQNPQGVQAGTFSFKYVPKGTYTVTLVVKEATNPFTPTPTAHLNGKVISASATNVYDGVSTYTITVTVNNVSVTSDSTLTVDIGGAG